ncbi:hypothetical protein [Pseudomonas sp. EggHat1]|uniref:hypothetical protein n=1 Tax=Pseudomonas sp. EggHat1 TaxID=2761624 RepID=UPI003B637EBF
MWGSTCNSPRSGERLMSLPDINAGGIPGQPEPDIPDQPGRPVPPQEPGEPTVPDQPPPAPVAHRRPRAGF